MVGAAREASSTEMPATAGMRYEPTGEPRTARREPQIKKHRLAVLFYLCAKRLAQIKLKIEN